MLVIQAAETSSTAETKLMRKLSKKQGISDKLEQWSSKAADLPIESNLFFLFFFSLLLCFKMRRCEGD